MSTKKDLIVKLENLDGPQSSAKDRAAGIAAGVASGLAAAVGGVVGALAGSSVTKHNEIKDVEFSKDEINGNIDKLIKKRVQSI